jgi:MtN3 and saliva related transmembrane protein
MNYEVLGIISGILGSVSIFPQIYKSYTSRSSKDLSTSMIVLTYFAQSFGILYGILIKHFAVYAANTAVLSLYVVLHIIKVRNARYVVTESGQEQELVLV